MSDETRELRWSTGKGGRKGYHITWYGCAPQDNTKTVRNASKIGEVTDAIRSLKNSYATGIDAIRAEAFKVDLSTFVGVLE